MSPTPEFTNMYTTISKEVADSLEESGQGWRIQREFGLETRMMFWRKRLIERLRNDHRNHNAELLPKLTTSNLFFPILITVLCIVVVLLCKNCILGIYEEIHKTRKKKKRDKQLRSILYQVNKPTERI